MPSNCQIPLMVESRQRFDNLSRSLLEEGKVVFLIIAMMFSAGFVISARMRHVNVAIQEDISTVQIFKRNKSIYTSLLLRHIGATAVFTVLPLMLLELAGNDYPHFLVSIVYVVNMVTATGFMMLMSSRIKLSNTTSFKIGVIVSIIAFSGMIFISEWWHIMPFMFLVGVAWAFMYIGGTFHLMSNNPKSTSMGIFNSVLSIAQVIGPAMAAALAVIFVASDIHKISFNGTETATYIAITLFMLVTTACAAAISLRISKKSNSTEVSQQ